MLIQVNFFSKFLSEIPSECETVWIQISPKIVIQKPLYPIKMDFDRSYSKTCLTRPLKRRPKIGFQDRLSLNAGQKFCRMLQGEHSAILLIFIKLPFVFIIFVLFIFEWALKTGLTVHCSSNVSQIDFDSR